MKRSGSDRGQPFRKPTRIAEARGDHCLPFPVNKPVFPAFDN